jgi:hypothetical protein
MKKILLLLAFTVAAMTSCQQKTRVGPVDVEAEKTALNDLFEKFNSAIKDHDITTMASFITEDALCLGTDPSEFWDKQQFTDLWDQTDTIPEIHFMGERTIKVAADGNSAIVVEQYTWPLFTPNIPWRNVYHLVKADDKWMILFFNCALIPRNEDLQKLNEALE